jgi:HD-like signal output (HDOD) protein
MQVLDDPRAGSTDLGNVISEDQGLAARVLAVVNSALFALPWRVESISAAVRVVGTSQIRDLAIATSVLSLFNDVPDDLLDVDGFRHHSSRAAWPPASSRANAARTTWSDSSSPGSCTTSGA